MSVAATVLAERNGLKLEIRGDRARLENGSDTLSPDDLLWLQHTAVPAALAALRAAPKLRRVVGAERPE